MVRQARRFISLAFLASRSRSDDGHLLSLWGFGRFLDVHVSPVRGKVHPSPLVRSTPRTTPLRCFLHVFSHFFLWSAPDFSSPLPPISSLMCLYSLPKGLPWGGALRGNTGSLFSCKIHCCVPHSHYTFEELFFL